MDKYMEYFTQQERNGLQIKQNLLNTIPDSLDAIYIYMYKEIKHFYFYLLIISCPSWVIYACCL